MVAPELSGQGGEIRLDEQSGEDIPFAARLMALADVFDALISLRVYKAALSFEQARGMIAEGRGKHFDPEIADVFLEHFDAFVAIATSHCDNPIS